MSATKHTTFNCPACGTMRYGLPDHPKDISQDAVRDLLEALKRLADYTFETGEYLRDDLNDLRRLVDAAIAKAEERD